MSVSINAGIGQIYHSATPGQELMDIARDILSIVPGHQSSRIIKDICERNGARMKIGCQTFLLSRYNQMATESDGDDTCEISLQYYLNPLTYGVLAVDYSRMSGEVVQTDFNFDSEFNSNNLFRLIKEFIISNNLSNYQIFHNYSSPTQPVASSCVLVGGITESSEVNFWSIHTNCVWLVKMGEDGVIEITGGEINSKIHFYENCNFFLKLNKIKIQKIDKINSIENLFAQIFKILNSIKIKLNSKFVLNSSHDDSSSLIAEGSPSGIPVSVLRKLRRALPVHKQKFDWNIHRLNFNKNLN
jgi:hypothetical protein